MNETFPPRVIGLKAKEAVVNLLISANYIKRQVSIEQVSNPEQLLAMMEWTKLEADCIVDPILGNRPPDYTITWADLHRLLERATQRVQEILKEGPRS